MNVRDTPPDRWDRNTIDRWYTDMVAEAIGEDGPAAAAADAARRVLEEARSRGTHEDLTEYYRRFERHGEGHERSAGSADQRAGGEVAGDGEANREDDGEAGREEEGAGETGGGEVDV